MYLLLRMHVLIADGVEASRAALRERLKAEGHTVSEARSAVEAFLEVDTKRPLPDAVLLTEALPAIHGGRLLGHEYGQSVLFVLALNLPRARLLVVQEAHDPDAARRAFITGAEAVIVRGADEATEVMRWLAQPGPSRRTILRASDMRAFSASPLPPA